jgi:KDO2-lipid IV(A) lauroyltransferase
MRYGTALNTMGALLFKDAGKALGKHPESVMSNDLIPLYRFWQPRFWTVWLALGILRLIVALPQPARMACGRGLGRVGHKYVAKRRKIARRNLELCFPELSPAELDALTLKHFESLGMSIIELGMAWWCSYEELDKLWTVEGIEHMHAALEKGRGAIMLSGHLAVTEVSGRALLPLLPPMAAMYRPSDNPMNDQIIRRCRGSSVPDLITKTGIRQLIKTLRNNSPVWYAADQAYEGKGAMLVPFFGEPAMTNAAISQIAKVSGAPVLPFMPLRRDNGRSYEIRFLPPLDEFPSESLENDALRVHKILEARIREAPEQYYWVHRRFKGRPEDYPDPYA